MTLPRTDGLLRPLRRRGVGKPSLVNSTKGSKKTAGVGGSGIKEQVAESLEIDPNIGRRKRQKSVSLRDERVHDGLLGSSEDNIPREGNVEKTQLATNVINGKDGHECSIESLEAQPSGQTSAYTALAYPVTSLVPSANNDVEDTIVAADSSLANVESPAAPNALAVEAAEAVVDSTTINSSSPGAKRPQKTLRLNPKTGTIGPPPSKKPAILSNGTGTKKKPGRSSTQIQSLVIIIKYGNDKESRSQVGQAIDAFLRGAKTYSTCRNPLTNIPKSLPQPAPAKSTHPFFLGKIAPKVSLSDFDENVNTKVAEERKAPSKKSSMTLGEAKSHSPVRKNIYASGNAAFHHFGNSNKIIKFPGAIEACWPPKGMVHIRAVGGNGPCSYPPVQNAASLAQKKSKYTSTETLAKDDILKVLAMKLDIDEVLESLKHVNLDDFAEPERSLRLPEKHFENGYQIQRRVRRELSVQSPYITGNEDVGSSEDELQRDNKRTGQANPALLNIYGSLPSSLTAFDRSQYETQSWVNKYSPCSAAEVLQYGREPFILREWLQKLTVMAVDTGASEGVRSRAASVASRRSGMSNAEKPGKKKRKSNKLEGFVISSEEEEDEMDEISDPEDDHSPQGSQRLLKKTVIRSSDAFTKGSKDTKKYKNAVIISGPSGCGKTAMVYGVAKELSYEVFEINSSSRRSGKEILERVGDMTRNHLVRCSENLGPSMPQDEDLQRISDALVADLKSGRQGIMNSFFKPKKSGNSAEKSIKTKTTQNKHSTADAPKSSKAPPKQQKQSLILLEEVDVLFEEDKHFWSTVMNLVSQSKRPVIMTCNDEALLPLQDLELHAIIRLSPPPSDIAIDYLLLIAAAEGHIIKRKAVKALYEARQFDLRATLTELDYWCQLGVGDRKGGLDWFYPRWPPGCDVDDHGHTIRVVSEGTYRTSMGWLGRDFIVDSFDEPDAKEEVLREAWNGWNIDLGDWHECLDMVSILEDAGKDSRITALSSYEAFAQSMSMADICAYSSLAAGNQVSKHDL